MTDMSIFRRREKPDFSTNNREKIDERGLED